jgi:hypothetical protein
MGIGASSGFGRPSRGFTRQSGELKAWLSIRIKPTKATLRRLQQLETRRSVQITPTDPSGAREELRARINRMAERWRATPEWESLPSPPLLNFKRRSRPCFHASEATRT